MNKPILSRTQSKWVTSMCFADRTLRSFWILRVGDHELVNFFSDVFQILFVINITAVFYLVFSYMPGLGNDVNLGYKRICHIKRLQRKFDLNINDVQNAIKSNRCMINMFTSYRFLKVWSPILILMIPMIIIILTPIFPAIVDPTSSYDIFDYEAPVYFCLWSLSLLVGLMVPIGTYIIGMSQRPFSKYEKIRLHLLSQNIENQEELCSLLQTEK